MKKNGHNGGNGQGPFVLGARSFGSISAVEGISPSKRLQDDLRRLRETTADKRRTELAETYGIKK